jgi:signal transduction histidine kinase
MPKEVRLQVFQRSFSTKGADRGLGTYSVKLLTEKYLKGKVSFSSQQGEGTTFFVLLPEFIS